MSFIFRQGLEFFMFACFTLCVAIVFPIYVVLITFTMLPLTIISSSRKWSNLSNWYLAPKDMQSNIYEYYRKNSKKLSLEWDIEKAKPLPLARLRRGFVSQELITSPQPRSCLITRLPAELRLQIYKEIILGNSTHVHITVHRAYKPGKRRPMSRMHGQFCNFCITRIPVNDCLCFDAVSYGPAIPRCRAPYPENSGRGILALSKTCRQIYTETIVLLYSQSWPPFVKSYHASITAYHLYPYSSSNILLQLPLQPPLLPPKPFTHPPGPNKAHPALLPPSRHDQNLHPPQPPLPQTAAPAQPPTMQLLQPPPLARHDTNHNDRSRKR